MAKEKPLEETLDEVREDDGQIYVPRDDVDFDPDDGLLSGTAIDGTSDIPDEPSEAARSDAENSERMTRFRRTRATTIRRTRATQ